MKSWASSLRRITARRTLVVAAATTVFAGVGGVAIASTSSNSQSQQSQASAAVGTGYAKHVSTQMALSTTYKTYISLKLPAGSYMVTARVELAPGAGGNPGDNVTCIVRAPGARSDFDTVLAGTGGEAGVTAVANSVMVDAMRLGSSETVTVACTAQPIFKTNLVAADGTITALRVASISYQ